MFSGPRNTTAGLSLALVFIGAFAGAACTSDGSGAARPGASLARDAAGYAEHVAAACAGMADQVAEIVRQAFQQPAPGEAPSPDELRSAAGRVGAAVRRSLDAIRAGTPPPSERPIVDSMLAAFEGGLQILQRDPGALESIGTGRSGDPFARADRLALGYGAPRCALSSAGEGGD